MSRREVGAHDLDADLPVSYLLYMLAVVVTMVIFALGALYFVWF